MLGALLAALLLASPDAVPIEHVDVTGTTVWPADRVLALIRVGPGPLHLSTDQIAERVASAYRARGYPAASAVASVEGATLRIEVDEGHLGRLELHGVSGETATWVAEVAALAPGSVVGIDALRAALDRIEDASGNAVERADWPPYDVRREQGMVVVILRLRHHGLRLSAFPGTGDSTPTLVNRVDGWAPWLGVDLTRADARGRGAWILHLRGSYGFTSDDPRYELGLERPLGSRVRVGYAFHDLTDSDDFWRRSTFEPAPATRVTFTTVEDYYRRKGHEAGIAIDAGAGVALSVSARIEDDSPLVAQRDSGLYAGRENPVANEGRLRSFIGALRWTRGDARAPLLPRSLFGSAMEGAAQVDASLEIGRGDFDFQRLVVHARGRRSLRPHLSVRGRGLLGFTGGDVPVQRRFRLGGSGTLRGREFGELVGDHMVLLTAEVAHEPRGPWPGLVAFWDGGAAWEEGYGRDGFRNDVGLGAEWPSGRLLLLRVDAAIALDPRGGHDRPVRVTGRLRLPF